MSRLGEEPPSNDTFFRDAQPQERDAYSSRQAFMNKPLACGSHGPEWYLLPLFRVEFAGGVQERRRLACVGLDPGDHWQLVLVLMYSVQDE